ncbi:MAG TPA: FAD-dependent oxidoreductase, partial [Propionibacteriaceae bacterium]|nr:FAD-dependent oxidoreductase [Propionibacteriaceae bacterium]
GGRPGTRVVVVGSGFIGCEAAASLATRDLDVVLIHSDDHPHTARLGADAGARIGGWLTEHGVNRRTGTRVCAIAQRGDRWLVSLDDGSTVSADEVVCGGGVVPNVELAQQAGLLLEQGGISTGSDLRTTDPHIFAVGDIAYALNSAAGRRLRVEHWGDADRHGTIAGTVAAGGTDRWAEAPGFWSGIGERTLKYSAWGDGYDEAVLVGTDTSWVVWYRHGQELCGVLAVEDDGAYERGQELLESRAPFAEAVRSRPDGR